MTLAASPRAVLFDMDGVLVDNSRLYAAAWNEFVRAHPDACQTYPAQRTFGRRNRELIPELFGRPIAGGELQRLSWELESGYWRRVGAGLEPLPGLRPFLAELRRRGIPTALASSAPGHNVRRVLEALRLEHRFDQVLAEEDVRQGKPDPEIYLTAAARLGAEARDCVVFEDALAGIAAARAAGAPCLALATTYPADALRQAGAAAVLRDFFDPELGRYLGWQPVAAAALTGEDALPLASRRGDR